MATIGKVRAVFSASSSGLVSGVNAAAASMQRLEASTSSLHSGMSALVAIEVTELFASVASLADSYVRSLVSMGAAQAEVIDQQSKLAARLGMTYGEFAGLQLAADLAGVSTDALATAATRADVAFVRAVNGSAQAQKAFATLGLSLDELGQMSAAERFQAIGAAIAALPTEAERAAAATAVFGSAGAQLLPLFMGGSEAFSEAANQAERLGLALTTAQGEDVEAMNDALSLASKAIDGIVQQVVAYLSPAVQAIADTFTELVMNVGGANIGQAIGDGILEGARYLAGIGDWLIANLSSVWEYASSVGAQWNSVAELLNRGSAFLSGVFNAAEVALGIIILGFGKVFEGLATIAQSIGRFLGFDTSSIDVLVAGAKAFNNEIRNGIAENANAAAEDFGVAFGESVNQSGQAIAGPLTTALDSAIAQAQASASQIDEAGQGAAVVVSEATRKAVEQQAALKAIDSRSAEGINEMFRLRRGETNVQEQQLSVLREIADNTDGIGDGDFDVMDLAPAAGG